MARRRVNFISGLRVSGEERCEDQDEPRNAAIQFYQQLFSSSMTDGYSYSVRGKLLRLDCSAIDPLAAIQRPMPSFPMDSIGWKLRSDGRFSIKTTYQICNKDWQIFFSKVARCNNGVAYWLAKFASDTNFDVMFFESPPDGMEFG
ncbi:hypothetical protein V6N11_024249 [Hibiscus sabdariffa]|uniref:Uncharacterized protein n=1 Tax=Hibiscus sabdariffa TaxID=183260 RepID=A0ABR2A222_9ROSI